jgi:hypothetical protein
VQPCHTLSQKSQLAGEFASTSLQRQSKQLLHLGNRKLKHDHVLMIFFPFSEPTLMCLGFFDLAHTAPAIFQLLCRCGSLISLSSQTHHDSVIST